MPPGKTTDVSRTILFPPDPAAVEAPSCGLAPDSMRERGAEWAMLRDRHMIDRQRIGDTLTSHWRTAALPDLRGLVEAEHECCPFFAFELTIGTQSITLRTTFPASMDPELFSGVG
jgi:hypothetical protein